MINSSLKDQIIGTYDEAMKDYLESDDVKYATWEWNKRYFSFRGKLGLDLQQEFDELLRDDEEMMQATADEALYRGVILGIAEYGKVIK